MAGEYDDIIRQVLASQEPQYMMNDNRGKPTYSDADAAERLRYLTFNQPGNQPAVKIESYLTGRGLRNPKAND